MSKSFSRYIWISVIMALLILVANALGLFLNHLWHSTAPIVCAIIATAVTTFFGFPLLLRSSDQKWKWDEGHLRLVITASIIVTYLDLVGLAAFNKGTEALAGLSDTMVNNFTTIVGVVIGFYFGPAVIEAIFSRKNGKKENKEDASKHKKIAGASK